jgi:pimeloyl-ACP methyl ester carboxylesterase
MTRGDLVTIDFGGRPARVLRAPTDGPAVVLIHGASGTAETWRAVLGAWSWADVWAVDLPGRGDGQPARDRVDALADWLLAGVPSGAILVGHSLGGAVAQVASLKDPDHLGGIALVASAARLRVAPSILDAVAKSSEDAPFPLDFAFGPDTPRAVIDAYKAASRGVPGATALADWTACDGFDIRDRLREIDGPSLVVHGDRDALTPARFQAGLAEALRAERVEIPGGGHMLPWEAPTSVSHAVRDWSETISD